MLPCISGESSGFERLRASPPPMRRAIRIRGDRPGEERDCLPLLLHSQQHRYLERQPMTLFPLQVMLTIPAFIIIPRTQRKGYWSHDEQCNECGSEGEKKQQGRRITKEENVCNSRI